MTAVPEQIPLNLVTEPDLGAQSFHYAESNSEARIMLERGNWANNTLALVGPKGCGKTHLGHIWAQNTGAVILDGQSSFNPKISWKNKEIWIDNAASADEFTLFTLINMAITGDISALLLSDVEIPKDWTVQIPDLHSRLKNVQLVSIQEPDDQLLTEIMLKIFKDRGLKVSDHLISYLLTNTERSVAAVRALIYELDVAAAIAKVNVTRSFAAKYLQSR